MTEIGSPRELVRAWRSVVTNEDKALLVVLVQAPSLQSHLQEAGGTILTIAQVSPSDYADT